MLCAAEAIGESCNCWFAQAIVECLSPAECQELLLQLGWTVNGERTDGVSTTAGGTEFSSCWIELSDRWDFTTIWSLIGETKCRVTPVWMAELAANYACTGTNIVCMEPSYFQDISVESTRFNSIAETLIRASDIWKEGYQKSTVYQGDSYIVAKTGTYETSVDDAICLQKNFFGANDHIAFFVSIENYKTAAGGVIDVLPQDVATYMLQRIEASEGE